MQKGQLIEMIDLESDTWGRILKVFVLMPLFSTIVFYFAYPYIDPLFPAEPEKQYKDDKSYVVPVIHKVIVPRVIGTFWLKGILSALLIRTCRYLLLGASWL